MKSMEAGVGIEPAYADLQSEKTKKSPDFPGSRSQWQTAWHKTTAQFWHSHLGAKHTFLT